MPHIPLFAGLSIVLTVLAVTIGVVSFVPTYLAGINSIEVVVSHLRKSIDRNINVTLTEYITLPRRVNALAGAQISKKVVPVSGNLTQYRTWCLSSSACILRSLISCMLMTLMAPS